MQNCISKGKCLSQTPNLKTPNLKTLNPKPIALCLRANCAMRARISNQQPTTHNPQPTTDNSISLYLLKEKFNRGEFLRTGVIYWTKMEKT